jgi:DNA-binding transcriptional LysR family regulator
MEMAILRDAALLRHFLAVAREGSVSAAAGRLAVTQPALTKSIHKLEARLGVTLFERLPRGIALTRYGKTLLPHARRIEAECHFAEVEMQAFRAGKTGRLRVGAGPYFGAAVVPGSIARLQKRFPDVVVELVIGVNELTLPRLLDGDLDLMFGALPEEPPPPYIAVRPLVELKSRVIAGTRHPLLSKRSVSAADLAGFPWAIYQQDHAMVARLFAMLRDEGAQPPRITAEVNSLTALIRMLKAGPYLSCFTEALVASHADFGLAVVPLARPVWQFQAGALVHRALEDYPPATMLFEFVRSDAEKLRRRGPITAPPLTVPRSSRRR